MFVTKVLRWILALVFAIAAGLKLGALGVHADAQGAGPGVYQTMFSSLPLWIRCVVIAVELALAAWLVSNVSPRWASLAAVSVLSVFLAAIVIELGKPQPKPCGCEGMSIAAAYKPEEARHKLAQSLVTDVALLLVALGAYFGSPARH